MRKQMNVKNKGYRILLVDDEQGIIDTIALMLKRSGYDYVGTTNPLEAIEMVRREHYDLMILDFLMYPIHGDKVVEKIREFNDELYILLLTGHKDLAPPLSTIKELDIQGYCEKSDRFDQLLLLIESGIKSISQMRIIANFRDGLNKILQAVPKIYQLQPIGSILEEILSQIMPLVKSQNAFILVDDISDGSAEKRSMYNGIGKYKTSIDEFWSMLSPEFIADIGHARSSGSTVFTQDGVIIPLKSEYARPIGVLHVESSEIEDGLKLLEIFSGQAASSLRNAFLHSLINIKNEELNRTYLQLKRRYIDTIEALRMAVDAKDMYTRGHSDRVAYYALELGKAMGLPAKNLQTLKLSGLFHDVGKIGTSDDLLTKDSRLSDDEFDEIKKHSLTGAHILSVISMFSDVVPVVKHHHERIDGKGYPYGLKGDHIPFLARIVSIADAYDAMICDRTYRSHLEYSDIKQEFVNGRGTQFDAQMTDVFLALIDKFPSAESIRFEQIITDDDVDIELL